MGWWMEHLRWVVLLLRVIDHRVLRRAMAIAVWCSSWGKMKMDAILSSLCISVVPGIIVSTEYYAPLFMGIPPHLGVVALRLGSTSSATGGS